MELIISGGQELNEKFGIDGFNQWDCISLNRPSPRNEVLIDIHDLAKNEAIRINQFKYING